MNFKKNLAIKISAAFFASAISLSRIFAVSPSSTVESDTAALMTALFKNPSGISNVKVSVSDKGTRLNASIGTFKDGEDLVGLEKGIVMGIGNVNEIFNPPMVGSFETNNVEVNASEAVPEVTTPQGTGTSEGVTDQNSTNGQGTTPGELPATPTDTNYYPAITLSFDIVPNSEKVNFQCVLASDAWENTRFYSPSESYPDAIARFYANTAVPDLLVDHANQDFYPGLHSIMANAYYIENDEFLETKDEFISTEDDYADGNVSYKGRSKVLTQSVENLIPGETNHIAISLMVTDNYRGNTYFFIGYNDDDDLIYSQDETQNKFSDGDDENDQVPNDESVTEPTIYHPETGDNLNLITALTPIFSSAAGLIILKRKKSNN